MAVLMMMMMVAKSGIIDLPIHSYVSGVIQNDLSNDEKIFSIIYIPVFCLFPISMSNIAYCQLIKSILEFLILLIP